MGVASIERISNGHTFFFYGNRKTDDRNAFHDVYERTGMGVPLREKRDAISKFHNSQLFVVSAWKNVYIYSTVRYFRL